MRIPTVRKEMEMPLTTENQRPFPFRDGLPHPAPRASIRVSTPCHLHQSRCIATRHLPCPTQPVSLSIQQCHLLTNEPQGLILLKVAWSMLAATLLSVAIHLVTKFQRTWAMSTADSLLVAAGVSPRAIASLVLDNETLTCRGSRRSHRSSSPPKKSRRDQAETRGS